IPLEQNAAPSVNRRIPHCTHGFCVGLLRRNRLGGAHAAVDECRRLRHRTLLLGGCDKCRMMWREAASRVGVCRISSEGHRLAAAATEIDLGARAAAAGLLHPAGAAILLEGLAVEPDVGETFVFDVVELETG